METQDQERRAAQLGLPKLQIDRSFGNFPYSASFRKRPYRLPESVAMRQLRTSALAAEAEHAPSHADMGSAGS
ncbi:hypothetical protein [Microvirga pakistanensis]|uniref:hypothetical protein n=1 Tax=Microvirga pakistanensis TaxID=1682650 RepID=UPI001FCE9F34|nr:hypothetical protein [Microvirga pakistanensis]